jgi:class 3 adenylate cyclase/pimeloyl-ACP methyl ester carboxylesterase/DNA-binding winged helix-turn-helix (wHTH) protein
MEPQAFDLLAYLVEHRDRVVTKDELIGHIWPERFISEAALTTRVMEARKALGDSGREQRYIRTVHGRGYRFIAEARVSPPPAGAETAVAVAPARPGSPAEEQQIRFCTTTDGVRVAYATAGEGPPLVKVANWLSHLEFDWRSPVWRHWIRDLSRYHRLVRYDERGCGLSDGNPEDFSFEGWLRDLEAVVDALGLERFPLLGISQGGPVAIAYAVRHPERVSHLLLYGTYARGRNRRMNARQKEEREALLTLTKHGWGRDDPSYRQIFTMGFIPDATPDQMRWFNDLQRASASAENAARFMEEFDRIDVEDLLPRLHVPVLVLHARDDRRVPFEEGRRLAAGIEGARFAPLEGRNHILLEDEPAWRAFLLEVRRFLGVDGADAEPPAPTPAIAAPALVTVLFTDIEGSTALTQRLGDEEAQELLRAHDAIVRAALAEHGGRAIKHTGDGIMASFASASGALDAAVAIQRGMQKGLRGSLRVRIGLNAGEPVAEGEDLFGTAVQLARRICDSARPGRILVANVVRELAAGKRFLFSDAGEVVPRGFDEAVRLYELRWEEESRARR